MLLNPNSFPMTRIETKKSNPLMMYSKIPMGTFVKELKTMAIPLAPPQAILWGIRNETRPTAVRTAPMVDKRYSLKIWLNMSSPPERREIIAWNAFYCRGAPACAPAYSVFQNNTFFTVVIVPILFTSVFDK